jgi:hypothetical protein
VLRIPSEDLLFREIEGQMAADVEVTVAEKTSAGEFEFWIERGRLHPSETLAMPKTEVLLRYTKRWKIKPETATVRIVVRDRFTGRHGTLDIPVKEILGEAVATPAEAPAK